MSRFPRLLLVISLLILFLSLGFSLSVSAQASPSDENLQAVLQAFATARHEGYHFHSKALTTDIYTAADGSSQSEYIGLDQEGDASANDDYQQTTRVTVGSSLETVKAFQPIVLVSLVYADKTYVYLDPADQWSVTIFGVHPGWWRFDDFRARMTDPSIQFLLDNTITVGAPADTIETGKGLLAVDYTGAAQVENRDMREYTLWNNVLAGMVSDLPGQGSAHFANVLKYARLFLSSKLSLSLQLQIGADDGRLYHLLMDSRRDIPYLSAGYSSEVAYDIENDSVADMTFTYPFKPIDITPPDGSLLNH